MSIRFNKVSFSTKKKDLNTEVAQLEQKVISTTITTNALDLTVNGTKPTWQDLLDNLVIMAGINGTEEFRLVEVTGSQNTSLCIKNTSGDRCLGDIQKPSDMNSEVTSITLGEYFYHNISYQGEGTLTSIKLNGIDISINKPLPLNYDYHTESTQLKVILSFPKMGGMNTELTQLAQKVSALVEITWAELKALRDGGNLVAGRQYRITDYHCTTTQIDTQSADHQFDIIVTADSASTLNENAHACLHSGDTYFSGNDANLGAWELKYSLDNDTDKFQWADSENGKGVIYWMKDEWNNECPYDFKNIRFERYKITKCDICPDLVGLYSYDNTSTKYTTLQDAVMCYTFNDWNTSERTYKEGDISLTGKSYFNKIAEAMYFGKLQINGNVFFDESYSNSFGAGSLQNTLVYYRENVAYANFCYNIIGDNCSNNIFANIVKGNLFGKYLQFCSFGHHSSYNCLKGYVKHCSFGHLIESCTINGGTDSSYAQNAQILNGIKNKTITLEIGRSYCTFVGVNSSGEVKTWCEADLIE